LLINDAVAKKDVCPITMEQFDLSSTELTSCYHLFEKDAIETWLSDKNNKSKCPVCKQVCKLV
jgi:SUMO ligase MMS21 Smc5/6 complex component